MKGFWDVIRFLSAAVMFALIVAAVMVLTAPTNGHDWEAATILLFIAVFAAVLGRIADATYRAL